MSELLIVAGGMVGAVVLGPFVIWAFTAFCFHASFGRRGPEMMKKYQDALKGSGARR